MLTHELSDIDSTRGADGEVYVMARGAPLLKGEPCASRCQQPQLIPVLVAIPYCKTIAIGLSALEVWSLVAGERRGLGAGHAAEVGIGAGLDRWRFAIVRSREEGAK